MQIIQRTFDILENIEISNENFSLTFDAPEIAKRARAGQFVHIRCGEKMLRRPISLCEIDKETGKVRIVYGVRGEGTKWMSELQKGDKIDILGPLGNGFTKLSTYKTAVFVGGGIGVPPLLETSKMFGKNAKAILGFRDKDVVILEEDFRKIVEDVTVTTDNGSYGFHGFVTQPLEEILKTNAPDVIYSCGPLPMLQNVAKLAKKYSVPCFVSLEERMACGVGACLVCACKIKKNDTVKHLHVCKEGPVFNAREVVFGG